MQLCTDVDVTQLLGAVVMLMLASPIHRARPIAKIERVILPPILLGQYFAFERDGRLVGWASWANLSEEAESAFVERTRLLTPEDWAAGDGSRIWISNLMAPYGGVRSMVRTIRRELASVAQERGWLAEAAHWRREYGECSRLGRGCFDGR